MDPKAANSITQPKPGSKLAGLRAMRESNRKASKPNKIKVPPPISDGPKPSDVSDISMSEMIGDDIRKPNAADAAKQESKPMRTATKAKTTATTAKKSKAATSARRKIAPQRAATQKRPDGLREGSKVAMVIDMACRKDGVTCKEAAKKLGWNVLNSSTLIRYCKAAGVKLRTEEKDGEDDRYFGTPKA